MLRETTLFETTDKVAAAVERIRHFRPQNGLPYIVAFSGGKDSVAVLRLTQLAGVDFTAIYNITTVDPPELVRFIRQQYPEVHRVKPPYSMFQGILRHGYPTRVKRWCCREFKERSGDQQGHTVITGVRWAESARRRHKHGIVTSMTHKTLLNPIVDWSDADVWEFIKSEDIPYCRLYDEGWRRIGCILCPFTRSWQAEADRWPGMFRAWQRAFQALWDTAPTHRLDSVRMLRHRWSSADALFTAWLDRDNNLHGDLQDDTGCDLFAGAGNA